MAIFYNEEFLGHVQWPFHPESPDRLRGIIQALKKRDLWKNVHPSRAGTKETLMLVHDEDYIDYIQTCGECHLTLDTLVHHETYEIGALAAECAIDAARHSKEHGEPSFALTRPPGHHAGAGYGKGFCYFNNISIAAKSLLKDGDRRIAIIDVDVHHGNGTEGIFGMDPSVLYISSHQAGIFPGTGQLEYLGEGEGEGFTLNMPFQSGIGDSTFDTAYRVITKPVVEQFKPDALLVSWGMDTHYMDPLASLSLSSQGHVTQAEELIRLARRACGGRITFMLEGGYHIQALSEVVAATVGGLEKVEVPLQFTDVMDTSCFGRDTIHRCKQLASQYWNL